MKTNIHLRYNLAELSLEWEMFNIKVVQKIKTNILCSKLFWKLYLLWDNVEKYCIAVQATDDSMVHAEYLRLQTHNQNM